MVRSKLIVTITAMYQPVRGCWSTTSMILCAHWRILDRYSLLPSLRATLSRPSKPQLATMIVARSPERSNARP